MISAFVGFTLLKYPVPSTSYMKKVMLNFAVYRCCLSNQNEIPCYFNCISRHCDMAMFFTIPFWEFELVMLLVSTKFTHQHHQLQAHPPPPPNSLIFYQSIDQSINAFISLFFKLQGNYLTIMHFVWRTCFRVSSGFFCVWCVVALVILFTSYCFTQC